MDKKQYYIRFEEGEKIPVSARELIKRAEKISESYANNGWKTTSEAARILESAGFEIGDL